MKYGKYCRRITAVLLCAILAASLTLSGCQSKGDAEDTTSSAASAASATSQEKTPSTVSLEESDVSTDYNANDSIKIMLSGKTAQIVGSGASCENGKITIDAAGTYLLSGKLEEGQIVIAANKDDEVRLVMDNVEITSSQTPVLYAEKCGKTIILLNQGSTNVLTGSSTATGAGQSSDDEKEAPDAAVYVQDALTILGEGSLRVKANTKNGITCKDSLKITGGTLQVEAAHHGITGKDQLYVGGGTVRVTTTEGDGLRSTYSKDDDENKGNVTIENADVQITSAGDGVQAEENVTVNSGSLQITTGGGAKENTSASAKNDFGRQQTASQSADDDNKKATKGLKAGKAITIAGGTVSIDAYDDAVHSNGAVMIKGGKITIQAGDDGIHSDTDLGISNGEIKVEQSYEGLEAQTIEISGGTVDITASDDGINCAGGNDSGTDTMPQMPQDGNMPQMPQDGNMPQMPQDGNMPQMPQDGNMPQMPQDGNMPQMPQDGNMPQMPQDGNMPQMPQDGNMPQMPQNSNRPGNVDESAVLTISGGTVYVNAQGDGLDSNGALNITGGTIVVNGTTNGGNGIIDHDGNCTVSGGLLIGAGTSDMLELPGDTSEQNTLAVLFDQAQSEGTVVYVTDSNGKVIASMSPLKSYKCLILSSPDLKNGESYTVCTGGRISGTAVNGYDAENTASGGKSYCTFTLSQEKVTYVNASGVTTYSGMFGGMGAARGGRMGRKMMESSGQTSGSVV